MRTKTYQHTEEEDDLERIRQWAEVMPHSFQQIRANTKLHDIGVASNTSPNCK
ncbi:hypothetical protein KFK09_011454 [Dendrobium nobile]|uniref:Uncharacterized protein n=1 Tax=Dendrobium nobile TaxID=94219 RepID=A0A8T3BFZ9_DENNO|nr:hypothetical protein KFK09_011454 [Dendrobium nobile]